MGLRDRILGKVKGALGREGASPSIYDASGLPTARSADGFKAVDKAGKVAEGRPRTYAAPNNRAAAVFLKDGQLYCIDNECRHDRPGETVEPTDHDDREDL